MQFTNRDLTQQYISLSYQDVVQRYDPAGPLTYYLDGLGYVLYSISKSAAGSEVLTPFSTASYTLTASYALTSTLANVAIVAETALTASLAETASTVVGIQFTNTSSNITTTGSNLITQISTGSYNAAFFDYIIMSGSNNRAGTVFGSWVNNQLSYTEISNLDIGNTSTVTMSMALSNSYVQLLANIITTPPWNIKAIGRYL